MRRKDREITDISEIKEVLETCKVCRLGLTDGEEVYIVPVNYGYVLEGEELTLYFHGGKEGKKIDMIRKNPAACVEMDCGHELVVGKTVCQYSYHFASIIGNGTAQIVEEPEEKLEALELIMKHQTGKDFDDFKKNPKLEKAVAIIKVPVKEYSCKKYM